MAWSTRQIADMAGTTTKAVRHYHSIGLLAEPERDTNGYKKYGLQHLVRLLRIKGLRDLGMPLARIAMLDRTDLSAREALAALDAEIEASIGRLRELRDVLARMLQHDDSGTVPTVLISVARRMSESENALANLLSCVVNQDHLGDLGRILSESAPEDDEFAALPGDADPDTIARLAERLLPQVRATASEYEWVADLGNVIGPDFGEAFLEIFNPAQIAVMTMIERRTREDAADPLTTGPDGEVR